MMVLILMGDYCGSVAVSVAAHIRPLDEKATRQKKRMLNMEAKATCCQRSRRVGKEKKGDLF